MTAGSPVARQFGYFGFSWHEKISEEKGAGGFNDHRLAVLFDYPI
jgi:hypothetical protein